MALSKEQLDALLAKGFISTDFYSALSDTKGKEQDKTIKKEGKQAEEDLRLAQNNAHVTPPAQPGFDWRQSGPMMTPQAMQDWATAPPPKPATPAPPHQNVIPTAGGGMDQLLAATNNRPGAPPAQPVMKGNTIVQPTPQQIAGFRAIEEEAKQGIPADQVAGGVKAPPVPATPAAPPKPLQVAVGQGAYNPYAGPADFEKFTTPAERARKTQLVEEEGLKEDIVKRSSDLQMKQDKELAGIMSRQSNEYAAMVENQAKTRQLEQQEAQANINKLWAESEALGKKKIDPTRAWSQLPTGNKILAGIGMFIGAGGTRKGGANPAVTTIEGFIDRDIKAQEFDIKNQSSSIESRRGLLQERIKQFGNNELARVAAKKDYLDVVENQVKAVVANNASDRTRLAADELLANLQERKNATIDQFNMLNDQRARQVAAQAAAAQAAANAKLYEDYKARRDSLLKVNEERIKAGLAPLDPTQLTGNKSYDYQPSNPEFAKNAGERTITLNTDPYTGKPLAQPQQFSAKTADDAKKLKEAQEAYDKVQKNLQNIQDLRKRYEGGTIDRNAVAVAKVYRQNIVGAIKQMDELGALDKGVENYVNPLVPEDPMEYSPLGSTDAQLKAFGDAVSGDFQSKLRTRLTPGSAANLPKSPSQLGGVKNEK
jgi:hypothetical protein